MFRPNWPSSGVQVVMAKESAASCNKGFFPLIVVVSDYFGYVVMWVAERLGNEVAHRRHKSSKVSYMNYIGSLAKININHPSSEIHLSNN
jgi:hypothetical protein